jgi:hypothetical protein
MWEGSTCGRGEGERKEIKAKVYEEWTSYVCMK